MASPFRIHDNLFDSSSKSRLREFLDEIITPEIKDECPGVRVLVLTIDEYDMMMGAVRESAERQRAELNRFYESSVSQVPPIAPLVIYTTPRDQPPPVKLTLNILPNNK